jgi:hypothetical protein
MNNLSEMATESYITESMTLRVQKIEPMKGSMAPLYKDILDVYVFDAAQKVRKVALNAIYSFASEQDAAKLAKAVETLTSVKGVNTKDARRRIADKLIEDNSYKF